VDPNRTEPLGSGSSHAWQSTTKPLKGFRTWNWRELDAMNRHELK
jgi:hypothetical protein